ncbi:hypothetical protein B0H19DRAFT_1077245 [Mycena capillaripes]|nr:hypothetical protein B0H19DRAFT_1077245 [Mycena capillaripes]
MDFKCVCDILADSPELAYSFSHNDVVKYIELITLLKPTPVLTFLQPSHQTLVPPATLPVRVHNFLRDSFNIPDETAKLAWEAFRLLAWALKPTPREQLAHRIKHVELFLEHELGQYLRGLFALSTDARVSLPKLCAASSVTTWYSATKGLGEPRSHPISSRRKYYSSSNEQGS